MKKLENKCTNLCPCGSGVDRVACCGRWLDEGLSPPTAESLMRSRYTAYVEGNEAYLLQSWHLDMRPACLDLAQDPVKWLGLDVRSVAGGGVEDLAGSVEFVARYKVGGRAYRLQEKSRFSRVDGRWCYVDGDLG